MAAIHAFVGGGENGYSGNLLGSSSGDYLYGAGWAYDGMNFEIDYTGGGGSLRQAVSGAAGTYLIEYEITSGGGGTYMYLDQASGSVSMGPHTTYGIYSLEVEALSSLTQIRIVSSSNVSIRTTVSVRRKY